MPFRLYFHSLTSLESTISNSAFPGVSDVEFVQCRALVGKAAQASKPFFSPLTIPALLRSFPHLPRLLKASLSLLPPQGALAHALRRGCLPVLKLSPIWRRVVMTRFAGECSQIEPGIRCVQGKVREAGTG